ncbi:MAG TPA: ATP-binding protein [Chryseosolibacter sp.]|nr:ATP-binding protein [Chryseosolibacter sp.]
MEIKPFISDAFSFLKKDRKVVDYIRHYDWENSGLGSPERWSATFKIAFSVLASARFPVILFWGEDNLCFYNSFVSSAISQYQPHPTAFGLPAKELWKSASAFDPLLNDAKADDATAVDQVSLFLEACFNHTLTGFNVSSVQDEDQNTCALLVTCFPQVKEEIPVASDHRFQKLVEQASVGILVVTGDDFRIDIINEMFGRLIGHSTAPLLGKPFFQLLPETEKAFRSPIDRVRATRQPLYLLEQPYEIITSEGKYTGYANLTYQPYLGGSANDNGVMVLYHDVTELVNSRKRIQDAEAKARLAIESADLGTYELNLSTSELITSERFRSIWGIQDAVSRREFADMIHPEDREIRARAHSEAPRTGQVAYEVRIIRPDNQVRWIKVNGRILYNENRNPVTLLGVVQDITPLHEFTDALAGIVRERTLELQRVNKEMLATNEELSESNEMLTNANKELEQFAYVASHDLQEPLRKILLFANILNDRFQYELPPGAQSYLGKISSSATRMSNLIKDLLDYSRLSYKKPLFQLVDLNLIVANIIQDFEILIKQKKVNVTTDGLPVIEGIPIHMNQVIYNLIGNALKFTRKGTEAHIHVSGRKLKPGEVKLYPRLKPGRVYYQISVSDNGIGFSQQYAEKIFTIFQQLNDKSVYGGYGIGLSLCRRIVDNHKGIIFATGEENKGATFSFIIPEVHSH